MGTLLLYWQIYSFKSGFVSLCETLNAAFLTGRDYGSQWEYF